MARVKRVILKRGREKPVRQRHPWIFSGALAVEEADTPGELVEVYNDRGEWLARGYWNPASQIRVRLLTWQPTELVDDAFWARRLEAALERRASLASDPLTTAYRMVNAEADGLPGLVVDRYDQWLVVQAQTLGIASRLDLIAGVLAQQPLQTDHKTTPHPPAGIIERSDDAVRTLEGLAPQQGLLWGQPPPTEGVEIREHGHRFMVDLLGGHKTGFYLDQRENRALVGRLATNQRVLNCFCYTGGFSVYAASAGAQQVVSVDSSEPALQLADRNLMLNGLHDRTDDELLLGNVFEVLRDYQAEGQRFDLIILDPPKFAHSAGQVEAACRGYKDINRLAFHLLNVGGTLATFSCSGLISADLFQKVVFGAALDAGAEAQVVAFLHQASDHPILLSFPESAYLKGLLCRKTMEV